MIGYSDTIEHEAAQLEVRLVLDHRARDPSAGTDELTQGLHRVAQAGRAGAVGSHAIRGDLEAVRLTRLSAAERDAARRLRAPGVGLDREPGAAARGDFTLKHLRRRERSGVGPRLEHDRRLALQREASRTRLEAPRPGQQRRRCASGHGESLHGPGLGRQRWERPSRLTARMRWEG